MTERATPVPPVRLRTPSGRPKLPDNPSLDDYARAFLEVAWNYETHAKRLRWLPYAVVINSIMIVCMVAYHWCVRGALACP